MAIFIIIGIWICAMICACPLITYRQLMIREWRDYVEVWCAEDQEPLRPYWFVMLVLLCYAPLTIVTIAYCVIIFQMDRYEHRLFAKENPIKIKYRRKIIQMLFIYLVCFFWSWFLFQVTIFYRQFKGNTELPCWYRAVYFVAHLLAYANSAINPIIYGAKSESFMRAFRIVCPCITKRKNKVAPSAPQRPAVQLEVIRPQQRIQQQQRQEEVEEQCAGDNMTQQEPKKQQTEDIKSNQTEETQVECYPPPADLLAETNRFSASANNYTVPKEYFSSSAPPVVQLFPTTANAVHPK